MISISKNIIIILGLMFVFGHTTAQEGLKASHLIRIHSAGAPADSSMVIHPLIVGPRIEFAFSNNLSWTTGLQFNTEFKHFNLDSRLQWRFRLRSDLYLLYTDNYLADGGPHRERNIELRVSYRLN